MCGCVLSLATVPVPIVQFDAIPLVGWVPFNSFRRRAVDAEEDYTLKRMTGEHRKWMYTEAGG